jgi:hypothetical protein
LYALHRRWYEFLRQLTEKDWQKTVVHPEHQNPMTLWYMLGLYSWHGRHHVAQITALKEKMKW